MRLLRKNMQPMKYALYGQEIEGYVRDEDGNIIYDHYEDSDGNIIYYLDENGNKIPLRTGEMETIYNIPIDFEANISMSGGEAEAKEYGLDVSDFDAVLILEKGAVPLTETSILWHTSPVKYKDENNTIVDDKSADYAIKRVSDSLNFTKVLLKRIVK